MENALRTFLKNTDANRIYVLFQNIEFFPSLYIQEVRELRKIFYVLKNMTIFMEI